MSILDLQTVKAHLRVDFDDEDELIQQYIDAAEDYCHKVLDLETNFEKFPPAVHSAVLLVIGDLYTHREMQVETVLNENRAVNLLLQPYRRLTL